MALLEVTLDETWRVAVARLEPGDSLRVIAPPCTCEVFAKPDRPWVIVRFDEFGVRPVFNAGRLFSAAQFAGAGLLYRMVDAATAAIEAGVPQAAAIEFEPQGTKQRPKWIAVGYELVAEA